MTEVDQARAVCGITAPAGGVEPLIELIENLPASTGVTYVVARPDASDPDDLLGGLAERPTSRPVSGMPDGGELEPGHVYLLAPGQTVTMDHQGLVVSGEAEHRDLTDELDGLQRNLKEFTQIVSHDLRAPLRHITALTTFLREDADGPLPEPVEARLTQIEERIGAMGTLIDDLLRHARLGAGAATGAGPAHQPE